MRNRYVLKLSKTGYLKYISHLDMMRLFRRAFKIASIRLDYTQWYNPHPRMSFAQPLPLGYSSSCEMLEFELKNDLLPGEAVRRLNSALPDGISVYGCERVEEGKKGLAATLTASSYEICIPAGQGLRRDAGALCDDFLCQEKIIAVKKRKKTELTEEIDIKGMIRELSADFVDGKITMYTKVDSGGVSNLSPELLISAFVSFSGIEVLREEIDVKRTGLYFGL